MIYFDNISKAKFRILKNNLKLNELYLKENIKYYELGENIVYFENFMIFVKNNINSKIINEKGSIYYKYNEHLINFFLKQNVNLKKYKEIEKKNPCKIINCTKNAINNFCQEHIILKSLKKYLYYKLINNTEIDFPYDIYI